MPTLLYVLALTLAIVASPAMAQLSQDATVSILQKLAEQGDMKDQAALGEMYYTGEGLPQNYIEAARWYRRAAEQGYGRAQLRLGVMYSQGQGVPQDYTEALKWFRQAAEQGIAIAQFTLGVMYGNGWGVPQDYTEALKWYRQAAEQGDANAQFYLGTMYTLGQGVPQDYVEAAKWYHRVAEQGHANAQGILGFMYYQGQGVPQNYVLAYFWLNLGAASHPPGEHRDYVARIRDIIAETLSSAQLARAQEMAHTWQPRAEVCSTCSFMLPSGQKIAHTWQPREQNPTTPVAPSPGAAALPQLVRPASPRRDLIRQVQERLKAVGFNPGAIDGAMGPQTRNALRWFQNTTGILATGEVDEKTLDALGVR